MKKIEFQGEVGMIRMDGIAYVRTIQGEVIQFQFRVEKEEIWDWNGIPVKVTIEEISPKEIKKAIKCPYRPIIEQELDRFEEEKTIRESGTFYWPEYPKRTLKNQQDNDQQNQ